MRNNELMRAEVLVPIMDKYQYTMLNREVIDCIINDLINAVTTFCIDHYQRDFNSLFKVSGSNIYMDGRFYKESFQTMLTIMQLLFDVSLDFTYEIYVDEVKFIGTVQFSNGADDNNYGIPRVYYTEFIDINTPNQTLVYKLEI